MPAGQCSRIRSSFRLIIQGESMKRKLLAVIVFVGAAVSAYAHAVPPPPPPPDLDGVSGNRANRRVEHDDSCRVVRDSRSNARRLAGDLPGWRRAAWLRGGQSDVEVCDCQQHVGAGIQPVPAGVCMFEVPGLAPGHYRASLLANEGMTGAGARRVCGPPSAADFDGVSGNRASRRVERDDSCRVVRDSQSNARRLAGDLPGWRRAAWLRGGQSQVEVC